MSNETKNTTTFESPLKYDNDWTIHRYGKEEKVRAYEFIDTSNSFNVDNRGELTTGEYVSYMGFLENPDIRTGGRFPKVNPTKEDYSNLVKLVEEFGLDL